MSIRSLTNTEGQNIGKISGRYLALDAGDGITLELTPNGSTKINVIGAGSGVVNSVNGYTGNVMLVTDDIPETVDKYFMTPTDTDNILDLQQATTDITTQINTINVPEGYAVLDVNGKIIVDQLPNSVMEFKGMYNIITNTPTLDDTTGNAGDVYMCSVAGTRDFNPTGPPNIITVIENDYLIYNGTQWEKANNVSYTRAEADALFVFKAGDTMTGDLILPTLYADKIGHGFNTDIIDLTGSDLKINKNIDLTDQAILVSSEINSNYFNGNTAQFTITRTGSIQNYTDATENINLTDTTTTFKKNLNMDTNNIKFAGQISVNKIYNHNTGIENEVIDMTGADMIIKKNVDLTNQAIIASTEINSDIFQGTLGSIATVRTGTIQNATDATQNIILSNTASTFKKNISLDNAYDIRFAKNLSVDKIFWHNGTWETEVIDIFSAPTSGIKLSYHLNMNSNNITNLLNINDNLNFVNPAHTDALKNIHLNNNNITGVADIRVERVGWDGFPDKIVLNGTGIQMNYLLDMNNNNIQEVGTLGCGALTCTSINTTNGNLTMGTGTITTTGTASVGALTCTSINTTNGAINTGTGDITTDIITSNGERINNNNVIEMGFGVAGKEAQAGKIGYGTFTAGALDIVGGGTTGSNRTVKIWDNLQVQTNISSSSSNFTSMTANTGLIVSNSAGQIFNGLAVKNTNNQLSSRASLIVGNSINADTAFDGFCARFLAGNVASLGTMQFSIDLKRNYGAEVNLLNTTINTSEVMNTSINGNVSIPTLTSANATITANATAKILDIVTSNGSGDKILACIRSSSTATPNRCALLIGSGTNFDTFAGGGGMQIRAGYGGAVAGSSLALFEMRNNTTGTTTALTFAHSATTGLVSVTIGGSSLTISQFASAGVLHSSSLGVITNTPIVNDDITVGTIADNKLASTVTNLSTANAIAKRDASGNIEFNAVKLTGNALRNSNNYATRLIFSSVSTFTGAGTNATITINVGSIFTSGTYGFSHLNVYTQSAGVNTMYNSSRYDITFDVSTYTITVKPNGANVWTNAVNYAIEYFIYDASL